MRSQIDNDVKLSSAVRAYVEMAIWLDLKRQVAARIIEVPIDTRRVVDASIIQKIKPPASIQADIVSFTLDTTNNYEFY
jgi:hypothetical protein